MGCLHISKAKWVNIHQVCLGKHVDNQGDNPEITDLGAEYFIQVTWKKLSLIRIGIFSFF